MEIPEGLYYNREVISPELGERLNKFLNDGCELFPVSKSTNTRKVCHYGYKYNYGSGKITDPAPDFPPIIEELTNIIYKVCGSILPENYTFNQCIINRYFPGQGINSHTDRVEYGSIIVCFTIGSGAEMEFRYRTSFKLYTENRSMYVMTGPSRYKWKHEMRARKSDPGHGKRSIRWSLTFRNVPQ